MSTSEDFEQQIKQLKRENEQIRKKAAQQVAEAQEQAAEAQEKAAEAQEKAAEAQEKAAEAQEKAAEAEKKAAEANRQKNELAKLLAPTDYFSYLYHCHHKLFLSLEVQLNSDLSSTGGVANVKDKFYPLWLKPWSDFPARHGQCQEHLRTVFGDGKHFQPEYAVEMIKDLFDDGPVADEQDMKQFQFFAVEAGTRHVLSKYLSVQRQHASTQPDHEAAPDQPTLPHRFRFLNNPYGLLSLGQDNNDVDETPAYVPSMVAAMQRDLESRGRTAGDGPPPAKRQSSPRPKLYPDQWCFRVEADDVHVPIFVIEYKAAHKLPAALIQTALSGTQDVGSLFVDVVGAMKSNKISLDSEVQKLNNAKSVTAQVVAQAFHYMVEFGLCYCYVASGEALLLLCLRPDDPKTLYYHIAVPGTDVGPVDEEAAGDARSTSKLHNSAIALVATLTLLALETPVLMQRWKQDTHDVLKRWGEPYEEMALEDTERRLSLNTPQLPVSPAPERCGDPTKTLRRRRDDDDSDYQPPRSSSTTTTVTRLSSTVVTRSSAYSGTGRSSDTRGVQGRSVDTPLQYCTQACLLGLRAGGRLDMRCPNVHLHQHGAADGRHQLTAIEFVECMREQLAHDLDDDCEGLDKYGKFGATSMLFRLTLQPYGYCLVAKGVQRPHAHLLEHERRIYNDPRVAEQQGRLVPVCLGIVDLVREYISYTGAHITRMLLMSYCGEPLWKKTVPQLPDMDRRITQAWAKLQRLGVIHGDERTPNVVWNEELQSVMCIDFGQAELSQPQYGNMQPSSPKRQRTLAT